MRRGARRARSRLVYETTMHASGKSVQMRRPMSQVRVMKVENVD